MNKEKILVSACLLGRPCRWHGRIVPRSSYIKKFMRDNPEIKLIPVCPEELGGLPTPRSPVKRRGRRVYETCPEKENRRYVTGEEVTDAFTDGAKKTLRLARKNKVLRAILCKWSPSCDREGITGRLLAENGIKIINTF